MRIWFVDESARIRGQRGALREWQSARVVAQAVSLERLVVPAQHRPWMDRTRVAVRWNRDIDGCLAYLCGDAYPTSLCLCAVHPWSSERRPPRPTGTKGGGPGVKGSVDH